ncbi:MAG: GNAT family N-acetyltransferase [Planctomycetes bacterium]|nr:GNAT family N-acetyltransferase [Planctomycetota bacterium]
MQHTLEVVANRRQRREFLRLPRRYANRMQHFVPPLLHEQQKLLDTKRHPFYRHAEVRFWLVRDGDGQPCGRISACVDRESLAFHRDDTGVFGHILADDAAVAHLLLEAAREFLRERGMRRMRGPIELSTNYTCGLQVGGFDIQPRIDIPQHPPELRGFVERDGLEKGKDLLCFEVRRDNIDMSRLERGNRVAQRRTKATIRNLDRRRWDEELERIHELYVQCWENNYAFAPMTRDEFFHVATGFRQIYVDGLCQIAEIDGQTVGFILGLPDINVGIRACDGRLFPFGFIRFLRAIRKTPRFRVLTLGVLPEYRGRGLDAFLITNHIQMSIPTGYSDAELSWVLEDNLAMIKPLQEMAATETIRLRLYEQAL